MAKYYDISYILCNYFYIKIKWAKDIQMITIDPVTKEISTPSEIVSES